MSLDDFLLIQFSSNTRIPKNRSSATTLGILFSFQRSQKKIGLCHTTMVKQAYIDNPFSNDEIQTVGQLRNN